MQISSRFTIAVHIFVCINTFECNEKVTSKFLAGSINTNPVIVRQIVSMLKLKGLVNSSRGSSGITIAKDPSEITLLDIFQAVDLIDNGELFNFHDNPSQECPVGKNIHSILDDKLCCFQKALEKKLESVTLDDLFESAKTYIDL
ncbi:Rrf2 family transcriptional regulator [Actinomyces sp. zg-332]|uniref:Rrf2 family transcriptional regulator n=1 Tax=Actinomyces sp. zg-332 TaxID=2708340 RepID=UPI00141E312B|nr:Rrf2 family transcriptional regulator [Actinomyces sp. zg-332]QPK94346.1 Rrf2 family transcriptional regulator [Actinomyces sp. zg-332]